MVNKKNKSCKNLSRFLQVSCRHNHFLQKSCKPNWIFQDAWRILARNERFFQETCKKIPCKISARNANTYFFLFPSMDTKATLYRRLNSNPILCSHYAIENRGRQNFNQSNMRKTTVFIKSHLKQILRMFRLTSHDWSEEAIWINYTVPENRVFMN